MRVKLKTSIWKEDEDRPGPMYGTLGEALYFRYNDDGNMMLHVLLYGWPGLWEISPQDVDPIH